MSDIGRFLQEQDNPERGHESYQTALEEIKNGKKLTHWIWYVFPQITGLGISHTSVKFAIHNKEEAVEYLNHPILGNRLLEITEVLLSIKNKTMFEVFFLDEKKLRSSMTLFEAVSDKNKIFTLVLDKLLKGKRCKKTLSNLSSCQ